MSYSQMSDLVVIGIDTGTTVEVIDYAYSWLRAASRLIIQELL